MIYIENVLACMVGPLLVACLCTPSPQRRHVVFALCGFVVCLLSAYMNTFFAYWYGTDLVTATTEIAPVIEEVMKFLPVLFYLVVFEPNENGILGAIMVVALGFATFENICYLVENGTENLQYLLIRGFGTGAMHIACGAIVGYGVLLDWGGRYARIVGIFGGLCIAIVFHGQYNLMMSGSGLVQYIACAMPVVTILGAQFVRRRCSL